MVKHQIKHKARSRAARRWAMLRTHNLKITDFQIGYNPARDVSKQKEHPQRLLLIRKLASPCRDRRPRLSVREKIDTQKAKTNPDRFFCRG